MSVLYAGTSTAAEWKVNVATGGKVSWGTWNSEESDTEIGIPI